MRWLVSVLLAAAIVFGMDSGAAAKSRRETKSRASSKATKAADVNTSTPKKNPLMTEAQIKDAQKRIEIWQAEAIKRHEELIKELYALRAVAIKERANDTITEIDEIITREKQRLEELARIQQIKNNGEKPGQKAKS